MLQPGLTKSSQSGHLHPFSDGNKGSWGPKDKDTTYVLPVSPLTCFLINATVKVHSKSHRSGLIDVRKAGGVFSSLSLILLSSHPSKLLSSHSFNLLIS